MMASRRIIPRKVMVSLLLGSILLLMVPGASGWPSYHHDPSPLPPSSPPQVFEGNVEGSVIGKLGGSGAYTLADEGSTTHGDGTQPGTQWGRVETVLPSWNYETATYSIYPTSLVKIGATDVTPEGTSRIIDFKTSANPSLDSSPFEGGAWDSQGPGDTYLNPTFSINPTGIKTTKIVPSEVSWVSYPSSGVAAFCQEPAAITTELDPAVSGAYMHWALSSTGVFYLLTMDFSMPFTDAVYGDYQCHLEMWMPDDLYFAGNGDPIIFWAPIGPYEVYSETTYASCSLDLFLQLKEGTTGTNPSFFSGNWVTSGPPKPCIPFDSITGYSTAISGQTLHWRRVSLDAYWTRNGVNPGRYIDNGGVLSMTILCGSNSNNNKYGYAFATFDSVTAQVSVTNPASLPLPIQWCKDNVPTGAPSTSLTQTFTSTCTPATTWSFTRGADLNDRIGAIQEYKVNVTRITAACYYTQFSQYSQFDTLAWAKLNGATLVKQAPEEPINRPFVNVSFADLETQPFYILDGAKPGHSLVPLQVTVGAKAPWNYDSMVFQFSAVYANVSVDFPLDFVSGAGARSFEFPDMKWMGGRFTTYNTTASPYLVQFHDGTAWRDPSPDYPAVLTEYNETDGEFLPLYNESFPVDIPWVAQSDLSPVEVRITTDTAAPAISSVGFPDETVFLNVGWQDFAYDYADVESPVTRGLLWWEQWDGASAIEGTRGYQNMTLSAWDGIGKVGRATTTIYPANFALGQYHWWFEVQDSGNNWYTSTYKAIEIQAEATPPSIYLRSPPVAPGGIIVYGPLAGYPTFEADVIDVNLNISSINAVIDGLNFSLGATGVTGRFALDGTWGPPEAWAAWQAHWDSLESGPHDASIKANDTNQNAASVSFTLLKDFRQPQASILAPAADTYACAPPEVTVQVTELDSWVHAINYTFDAVPVLGAGTWYTVDFLPTPAPAGHNFTFTIASAAWVQQPEGSLQLSLSTNDTGRNWATIQSVTIMKDSVAPRGELRLLADGSIYTFSAPGFQYLVKEETLLANVTYRVGTAPVQSIPLGDGKWSPEFQAWIYAGTINQSTWNALPGEVGGIVIEFRVYDATGNYSSVVVSCGKDVLGPRIRIISPLPGSAAGGFATSFYIEIDELNPLAAGAWYSLDNGVTLVPISGATTGTTTAISGTFDQVQWDAAADAREMKILFLGRDALGNNASAEIVIIRSDVNPELLNLPWQVWLCFAGAVGATFSINMLAKRRKEDR